MTTANCGSALFLGLKVLGVKPGAIYTAGALELAPGEALYLYTDGVTEAFNEADDMFTEQRLEAVLAGSARSCTEIIGSVVSAVGNFVGAAPRSDDIAMLALRGIAST